MISQSFCFGMMVTQLILCGVFVSGLLFIVGHEIVRVVKR